MFEMQNLSDAVDNARDTTDVALALEELIAAADDVIELRETHRSGMVSIHNQEFIEQEDLLNADFGLQISSDGRVWVCINGMAFIRFKPR